MSVCHSEEITPDMCISSSTNTHAALEEKCFSHRAGVQAETLALCLQELTRVQIHGKHLSPTVTEHAQLAQDLAPRCALFPFKKLKLGVG